jgi:hypothetical protein
MWEEVLSEMPRGSVLGPLHFMIFINDIDGGVEQVNIVVRFTDETKKMDKNYNSGRLGETACCAGCPQNYGHVLRHEIQLTQMH